MKQVVKEDLKLLVLYSNLVLILVLSATWRRNLSNEIIRSIRSKNKLIYKYFFQKILQVIVVVTSTRV